MTFFDRGYMAARMGSPANMCRLEGAARIEWMQGFRSYTPQKTEIIDIVELGEIFAETHFKAKEDEN
jgi:hypothetical protein